MEPTPQDRHLCNSDHPRFFNSQPATPIYCSIRYNLCNWRDSYSCFRSSPPSRYLDLEPHRGGVKHISGLIYEETCGVLKIFLENVICNSVTYTEQTNFAPIRRLAGGDPIHQHLFPLHVHPQHHGPSSMLTSCSVTHLSCKVINLKQPSALFSTVPPSLGLPTYYIPL
ncbi:hypothetical protein BU17DRAFT_39603 [Hysterangium stoloniferum]|nr:hypothetical protein BU17DRAFT_39603 [Hysterangium stoloniferum]